MKVQSTVSSSMVGGGEGRGEGVVGGSCKVEEWLLYPVITLLLSPDVDDDDDDDAVVPQVRKL